LVLGLGPVGRAAATWLLANGKRVTAYDPDPARAECASAEMNLVLVESLEEGLESCDLILDATPSADLIGLEHVWQSTVVAAPGMPLGVTDEVASMLEDRLLHEPLALGVATMAVLALGGDSRYL
jgi:pyrrolysine biosynthesis protein PylD